MAKEEEEEKEEEQHNVGGFMDIIEEIMKFDFCILFLNYQEENLLTLLQNVKRLFMNTMKYNLSRLLVFIPVDNMFSLNSLNLFVGSFLFHLLIIK